MECCCSGLTLDERCCSSPSQRPLPSIAASVPRSRFTSTLPAFTIPVPDSRLSSTLPASSGTTKLSKSRTDRRSIRCRDVNKHDDLKSHQTGKPKRRRDKRRELVLRVVPIDISDGHSSCQQEDVTACAVDAERDCTAELANNDSSDDAPQQFQRTAKTRQGKFFKKSGRKTLGEGANDVHSDANNESPQEVCTAMSATAGFCTCIIYTTHVTRLACLVSRPHTCY